MKWILKIAAICAVLTVLEAKNAAADIRFGIAAEAFPPFASKDASDTWVGWEIDLMDAVCRELKERCEIVEIAWDGMIPALISKKLDVIWSSMSITDERKKVIDFTDKYFKAPTVIVGAKNGDKDISPPHLAGKAIGVQISSVHENYAQKYFGKRSTIKMYSTQDEVNQDLIAGRIDYMQANAIALDAFLRTEIGQTCCELKGPVPDDPIVLGEGAGGGLRRQDADLKAKLNAALKAVRDSGEYNAITKKYFNFDINGD